MHCNGGATPRAVACKRSARSHHWFGCFGLPHHAGYTIIIYLLKVPKISAPSRVFSLLAQAPCRWALKGYISYMNRSGKMNGIYAAAAC